MFTGLIQQVGEVASVEQSADGGSIIVRASGWGRPLERGESIAVSGACLTLTGWNGETLTFDVLQETFDKTSLGGKRAGDLVNLERALALGDPLGGHMVTGHVDGTGVVRSIERVGRDRALAVTCGPALAAESVMKGSIACDGISLTIVDVGDDWFSVHIIPHTWEHTALRTARVGGCINLETDLLGKYVRRYLQKGTEGGRVTMETLRKAGYLM